MTFSPTTIKVPSPVRDRLRRNAKGRFRSLAEYLDYLADLDEHKQRMAAFRESVTSGSPEQRAAWRLEDAAWERTELADGLTS
ncbi:MAG: hypothetical protein LBR19_07030 [Bifidobacteriaceae bacterium]|jgi:hypothetical protein|nr:hypothetical protein [Bifidobacteriaceae bacterium]